MNELMTHEKIILGNYRNLGEFINYFLELYLFSQTGTDLATLSYSSLYYWCCYCFIYFYNKYVDKYFVLWC